MKSMANLKTVLGEYLRAVGATEAAQLGGKPKVDVTPKDNLLLIDRLRQKAGINNSLVIALMVLHFLIFFLAAALVYYQRESPNNIKVILGGSLLSLLALTRSLAGLWRDKTKMDMLVVIIPSLSPQEAVKAIQSIYYSSAVQAPRRLR
jgi:hypothetical protein